MLQIGSKSYNFLQIIHHLVNNDLKSIEQNKDLKETYKNFQNSSRNDDLTTTIEIRDLFLRYDTEKKEEEK
jgi:hypothetical protein